MDLRSLAVIVLLSTVFVCVIADYRLEIRVFSYNNPSHRCATCGRQQACCDGRGTESCNGPEQCDNNFIFCLRPLGTSGFNRFDEWFCPLGRYSTTFILQNRDSFTFEEGEVVLNGLPNPLVFTGPRWTGGAQLFAVVQDVDPNAFVQIVDGFVIDQSVEVGENFSTPTNHSGRFSFGYFVLSFRVTCTENFYGSDCTTFCMERDDDLGHYTCDSEGNIVCRERFQDPSTNCTECREGYTGDNCATDLDRCGHTTPCQNGATCNNTGPDQYECLCAAGFEGDSCERETNECDTNPCMNGGTCTGMDADHSCNCVNGFTGRDCEVTINSCLDVRCSGNGQCMESRAGSFTCVCDLGYTGDLCGTRLPLTTTPSGTTTPSTPSGTTTPSGNLTAPPPPGSVETGDRTGVVAGGVVGGLLGALLLALLVAAVVVFAIMKYRSMKTKELTAESYLDVVSPGDNPTYGLPYTAAALALPMSSLHTVAANGTSGNSVERDFDNPLYTSRELPNHEYASPGHVYATLEPGKGSYDYLESAELGHQHHPQTTSSNWNNGLYEHNSRLGL